MRNERCDTCRFFDREGWEPEFYDGACRRFPPQRVVALIGDGYVLLPPFVDDSDWCGEWQGKKSYEPTP